MMRACAALSPSRAGDFLTCPLLYRFRVIDRLPEPPSPAAARGTLVHAVLEHLFDRPAAERTPEVAQALLDPEWDRLVAGEPELASLFAAEDDRAAWLQEAGAAGPLLHPGGPAAAGAGPPGAVRGGRAGLGAAAARLHRPAGRGPGGETRIVDYKTGKAPPAEFEARALFQMKFYALVLWRARGRLPRLLQLMYLGNGEIVRYEPDEADLLATERKIEALWQAIERARVAGLAAAAGAAVRLVRAQGALPRVRRHPARPARPAPAAACQDLAGADGPGDDLAGAAESSVDVVPPQDVGDIPEVVVGRGGLALGWLERLPGRGARLTGHRGRASSRLRRPAADLRRRPAHGAGHHEQHDGQAGQGHAGPDLRGR